MGVSGDVNWAKLDKGKRIQNSLSNHLRLRSQNVVKEFPEKVIAVEIQLVIDIKPVICV